MPAAVRSRWVRPSSWPVAVKISIDLLLAALIPLGIAVWFSVSQGRAELGRAMRGNLELVAGVTSARLDQLMIDTGRLVAQLARDDGVVALTSSASGDWRAAVDRRLRAVVETNPDVASIFVTDAKGRGIAGTSEKNLGMDFNFREYYQRAAKGDAFVSAWLVGTTSGEPGVYFSAPVRAAEAGQITGVVVIKLDGHAVWRMTDEVKVGSGGHAIVIDDHGVIIAHPRRQMLYHSVVALTPEQIRRIDPERTYGTRTIPALEVSGMTGPASPLVLPRGSALISASFDGERRDAVAAWSRMGQRPWTVAVLQPRAQFEADTGTLVRRVAPIAAGVAVAAAVLALWRARKLVRPVLAVTDAANRLAAGDFDARAEKLTDDEVGRLADTFNEMVPQLRERVDLQQSLRVAMEVQQSLLPRADPTDAHLDIAGRSRYCDATGGDYFDFIDVSHPSPGTTLIAVGDVMGHGIAAALLMASARAALRAHASEEGKLSRLMDKVNRVLAQDARHNRFMTLILVLIDSAAGTVRWASAGHDPTLVYHPSSDGFDDLDGGDIPLGIVADTTYEEFTYSGLLADDTLVIGTDGVWEMRNPQGEMFGKDRLKDVIRLHANMAAAEVAAALEQSLAAFRDTQSMQDDVTFVIARVRPQSDGPAKS